MQWPTKNWWYSAFLKSYDSSFTWTKAFLFVPEYRLYLLCNVWNYSKYWILTGLLEDQKKESEHSKIHGDHQHKRTFKTWIIRSSQNIWHFCALHFLYPHSFTRWHHIYWFQNSHKPPPPAKKKTKIFIEVSRRNLNTLTR